MDIYICPCYDYVWWLETKQMDRGTSSRSIQPNAEWNKLDILSDKNNRILFVLIRNLEEYKSFKLETWSVVKENRNGTRWSWYTIKRTVNKYKHSHIKDSFL